MSNVVWQTSFCPPILHLQRGKTRETFARAKRLWYQKPIFDSRGVQLKEHTYTSRHFFENSTQH